MKENNFFIYETDNNVEVTAILEDENIWLTQEQIGKLYNKAKSTISEHIRNVFEEKELDKNSVVRNFRTTAKDGKTYSTNYYNLDMIIAVGFRVKSSEGTKFRIWANKKLKDYLVKGYNINVERFKNNGADSYFDELLDKIRDIRSSEKVFWRKILDIYATSIDYDPKKTAAEIVYNRVDSNKENIGLTNFKGDTPTRKETEIAKNYLSMEELQVLNRLVSAYLDVAEINALKRKTMTMKDWIGELDSFLTMTHNDILHTKGTVSHEEALKKAHEEYDKYMKNHLTKAENNEY